MAGFSGVSVHSHTGQMRENPFSLLSVKQPVHVDTCSWETFSVSASLYTAFNGLSGMGDSRWGQEGEMKTSKFCAYQRAKGWTQGCGRVLCMFVYPSA